MRTQCHSSAAHPSGHPVSDSEGQCYQPPVSHPCTAGCDQTHWPISEEYLGNEICEMLRNTFRNAKEKMKIPSGDEVCFTLDLWPFGLSLNISHYRRQRTGSHRIIYWRAMGLLQEKNTKENSANLQLSAPYLHARCICPGAVSQFKGTSICLRVEKPEEQSETV